MKDFWARHLAELDRRRARSRELGGPERVARQHAAGKLTIRERIAELTDSFHEIGTLATFPERDSSGQVTGKLPASYVCGLGEIGGRKVAIGGEDFTVRGGAPQLYLDRMKGGQGGFVEDLAHQYRIPLILLMEGIGGDVAEQDDQGHSYLVSSFSWARCFELLGEVPVLVAVLGPAAGGAAGRAVLSHFSVMARHAVLFAGGPPLVKRALGLAVSKEELGGPAVHAGGSGAIDNAAGDDRDALAQIRRVLSYLPSNVWQPPPRGDCDDPTDRPCEEILDLVPENPRRPYQPRDIIGVVMDRGSFFEIGAGWGTSVVTGLARLGGAPTGVLATDPRSSGGALTGDAADKQVRFMDLCSTFHLPMVYFVDVPGFMIGPAAERGGVVRKGMRAIKHAIEAEVPILTVHVRRAYGMAVCATANIERGGLRVAWPTAEWGDMPIEGGVAVAFRREIEAAADPEAMRLAVERRMREAASPWLTAEAFGVEEMIDPRETRAFLAPFIEAHYESLAAGCGPARRAWRPGP